MKTVEIDFLYVDSGEKSGDAIAFRYWDTNINNQKVVIIDGGTLESGKNLITHIKNYYNTNTIDLVICTHPDADHVSGLREVLNNCDVKRLWIHMPWNHSEEIHHLFHDGRITSDSLDRRIREAYNFAHELTEIANSKGITIEEPFAGTIYDSGILRVLGPTREYYQSLLLDFARTPKAKESVLNRAFTTIKETVNNVLETFSIETLDESGETSAENKSSAIILLTLDGEKFLFTGDAGIESMHKAIDNAQQIGIDLSKIRFMQVPHHGSKRNLSPSVLNRVRCATAYISASKDSDKHPSKKVVNALIRRYSNVFTTDGVGIFHNLNASNYRNGWGAASQLPFYDHVEE